MAADLIIYALVALFIIHRLYSAFGRQDGSEEEIKARLEKAFQKQQEDMVEARPQPQLKHEPEPVIENVDVARAIDEIKQKDNSFRLAAFISGAKMAFEMVLKSFSARDKTSLKNLLSADIYEDFIAELDKLGKNKSEITLVAINSANVTKASLHGSRAQLEISFRSEQVRIIKDENGNVIEGNPSKIEKVHDEWVFERDLSSKDPNWTIIAT